MSSELDALRRRSDELGVDTSGEAIATNREILRLVPADPIASNRLGIALLRLGELAEAEAVLSAALEAHPDNDIARNRLSEVRRKQAAAATGASNRPVRSPVVRQPRTSPTYWIKSLHYHDDDGFAACTQFR